MVSRHIPTPALSLLACVLLALAPGCRILQYNIGNGAGHHGEDDVIAMMQGGDRPTVITLNEVCGLRFYEINHVAVAYDYSAHFEATNPGGCGGSAAGLGYGNAIFVHGDPLGPPVALTFDRQAAGEVEERNIACVSFAPAGSGRAMACVTHLDDDPHVADDQALEALTFVSYFWVGGGEPWAVVGGDFNLEPDHPSVRAWRESPFKLTSSALTPTHQSGRVIDYVFATHTRLFPNSFVRHGDSDHHMVFSDVWE